MNSFETLPEHIQRPALRPIQPVPVQKEGQMLVALRDPAMISQRTMVVSPQVLQVLQQFQGQIRLDDLAARTGGQLDQLVKLSQGLDQLGLLWGPTFEQMEQRLHDQIRQRGAFQPRATVSLGEDAAACRRSIEQYLSETEDPELDATPAAIIAPHLDYERGWPNYAAAYHCVKQVERPDRVVILGTNHFGLGDGVVVTEFALETPLGRCPVDQAVISGLVDRLGRPIVVDQLDHLPEHSIELQLPWVQHLFGDVPIVAALVPDPLNEMIDDSGESERVSPASFATALREVIDDAGGRTLWISSADLSHVGPEFGEPRAVDDQRRTDVERHDRDMLGQYLTGDAEAFISALQWNRNPTRWCSIGNMSALLQALEPEGVELLDYRQACDDEGRCLVSSAAMAVL